MEKAKKVITWAGLDVAKASFDAALYLPLEPGQLPRNVADLPSASFPRTIAGMNKFLHWTFLIREKAGLEGGSMRIVMESTGRYSKELTSWLNQEAPFTSPAIEDSKTVHDFIKSLKLRNKTDRIDAGAIARYGAERMPEPYEELPEAYRHLRELTRLRIETKDQLTAARLRLAELDNFPQIIKIQRELVKSLEKAVTKLELEINRCINSSRELRDDVAHAVTIPGVALITASTVLAECGPLRRYRSRELGSYSGLAPVLKESGTSVHSSRVSRRGPGKLRRVLFMASIVANECNPEMKMLYNRLIAKGKKPLQARCAVMRKLLILIRAVVVNGTEFKKNYPCEQVLTS